MDLCDAIVKAAFEVHAVLGHGLLENIYELALCHELGTQGIGCQRQVAIPVLYKGVVVRPPLYLDILVENQVIVEVKSAEKDYPYYQVQLFTQMKLLEIPKGFLINFGKLSLHDGVCRLVHEPLSVCM